MMTERSKWIAPAAEGGVDVYGEYRQSFVYRGDGAELLISADSNYAVYINGVFVNSGQYPDFPYYKVYDKLDVSSYCQEGENLLAIVVWHYGKSNMGYYLGQEMLRFELQSGGELLAASTTATESRRSRAYQNGFAKVITGQLGFSFKYDLNAEDGWLTGDGDGFSESRTVDFDEPLFPRPVRKVNIGTPISATLCKEEGGVHYLFDLGRESVGYLDCKFRSATKQNILIAYGEHIVDGGVRYQVGKRDFSMDLVAREGENVYFNPFRRLGLRYLEVFCEAPIEIDRMTVRSVEYPVKHISPGPTDPLRKQIYDVAVRTLELCMHDHYEDTPWREQALYAMDSRNQILCGYYAFGEFAFPRASLYLISRDNREDGLLSICTPSDMDLTIPSFSLHYITEVYEYVKYSGDLTLLREVYPKMLSVLSVFTEKAGQDGRISVFMEEQHWNFYEWSRGLDGPHRKHETFRYDAALSMLLLSALRRMQEMAEMLGRNEDWSGEIERLCKAIREDFFDRESGLYVNSTVDPEKSQLVNSLAILCGVAAGEEAGRIAAVLADSSSELTPITLSMACFKYDALLAVDFEGYREWILSDIDQKYKRMLDAGATSFWETELGESDFQNAGSLCHGWSSMPIYYYHILLEELKNRNN